jgi:hypothetical protein
VLVAATPDAITPFSLAINCQCRAPPFYQMRYVCVGSAIASSHPEAGARERLSATDACCWSVAGDDRIMSHIRQNCKSGDLELLRPALARKPLELAREGPNIQQSSGILALASGIGE